MKVLETPTLALLTSLEPFSQISEEELERIAGLIQQRRYEPGEILIHEADVATRFFVLIDGKLEVIKSLADGGFEILNTIQQPGELFGEMALVEDIPRSAGIVARETTDVLVIYKEQFLGLVNHFPQFTLQVAKSISSYLRRTDATLIASLEEKNDRLENTISELKNTREALVNSERLSIIGRMAGTILHDLKNPMTTIAGLAQLIGMKELPREQIVEYTDMISKQVVQFNNLAQELLAFASGGSKANLVTVEFPEGLKSVFRTIQFNLSQNQVELVQHHPQSMSVCMDVDRFGRVLENLAKNAMEAMNGPGTITISSHTEPEYLVIDVQDTGPGMEPEVLAKVFDAFFTHKKRGGTGLGLAIVKSIMDDHNGDIQVTSAPGEGTCFTLKVPLVN